MLYNCLFTYFRLYIYDNFLCRIIVLIALSKIVKIIYNIQISHESKSSYKNTP